MTDPTPHYDTVADAWSFLLGADLHYGYFVPAGLDLAAATDALTEQMLRSAALSESDLVLDVGCGTGNAACRIANEVGCSVTGISPSVVCVENSSERARSLRVEDRATFEVGDGTALSMQDSSFDCTWIMESSHLMRDKPSLIRECARVLRPGGRLILCDIMARRELPLSEVIRHRDAFLLLQAAFGRARMESLEFYRDLFEQNGFEVVRADDISAQTRKTFEHWRANALANRGRVVDLLGTEAWQEFVDSCDVLDRRGDGELLGYGIVAAVLS